MKAKLEQSIYGQKAKWQVVAEHLCTALPEDEADAWAEGYLRGYLYQETFSVRWKHPAGCASAVSAAFGDESFRVGILAVYEDDFGGRESCVAAIAAAVAAREYLEQTGSSGGLVIYGCSRQDAETLQQAGIFEETDLLLRPELSQGKRELADILDYALSLAQQALGYLG